MKNIYQLRKSTRIARISILVFVVLTGLPILASAQVIKSFTQRTSVYSPEKRIYSINGDFTMIGNTNLQLAAGLDWDEPNSNNQMVYVDIDDDPNTWNSSSANLGFSTENGAVPSCSNIIYAGLYWTGRAHNGTSPNPFTVSRQIPSKVAVNSDFQVSHNGTITYTDYTMTVTRMGNDNAYYPRYTFTSSGSGPKVIFESLLLSTNYQVRYSLDNGNSWTIPTNQVVTTPEDRRRLITFDAVTVYAPAGGIILTINQLRRDYRDDRDLSDTQSRRDRKSVV